MTAKQTAQKIAAPNPRTNSESPVVGKPTTEMSASLARCRSVMAEQNELIRRGWTFSLLGDLPCLSARTQAKLHRKQLSRRHNQKHRDSRSLTGGDFGSLTEGDANLNPESLNVFAISPAQIPAANSVKPCNPDSFRASGQTEPEGRVADRLTVLDTATATETPYPENLETREKQNEDVSEDEEESGHVSKEDDESENLNQDEVKKENVNKEKEEKGIFSKEDEEEEEEDESGNVSEEMGSEERGSNDDEENESEETAANDSPRNLLQSEAEAELVSFVQSEEEEFADTDVQTVLQGITLRLLLLRNRVESRSTRLDDQSPALFLNHYVHAPAPMSAPVPMSGISGPPSGLITSATLVNSHLMRTLSSSLASSIGASLGSSLQSSLGLRFGSALHSSLGVQFGQAFGSSLASSLGSSLASFTGAPFPPALFGVLEDHLEPDFQQRHEAVIARTAATVPTARLPIVPPVDSKETKLPDSDQSTKRCAVCMERAVATVILECNHAVLCVTCARALVLGNENHSPSQALHPRCPCCRQPITRIIKPFF